VRRGLSDADFEMNAQRVPEFIRAAGICALIAGIVSRSVRLCDSAFHDECGTSRSAGSCGSAQAGTSRAFA